MKKTFIGLILGTFVAAAYAAVDPAFILTDPSDGHTTGTINGNTNILNMIGGYTEGGSSTLTNSIDGNAATATSATSADALASDPTACTGSDKVSDIAANGTLTCSTDIDTDTFVTNKDSHDHLDGDGAQIQHTSLGTVGVNDHHLPTVDTDTNATTICTGTEFLQANGTCDTPATILSEANGVTGPHTTDTNAGTLCEPGEYLDGDTTCKTASSGGGHTISTSAAATSEGFQFVQRGTLTYDSTFFSVTDDATTDQSFVSLNQNLGSDTWIVVDEAVSSGGTEFDFTGLDTNTEYKITFEFAKVTSSNLVLRINNDSSAIYQNAQKCQNTSVSNNTTQTNNANGYIFETNNGVTGGESVIGEVVFRKTNGDGVVAIAHVTSTQNNVNSCRSGVKWNSTADMTSAKIEVVGGSMNGTAKLWKVAPIAVGSAISVPVSSSSKVQTSYTGTGTTWSGVPGSTVTMTTAGGDVLLSFVGTVENNSPGGHVAVNLLCDGSFCEGLGESVNLFEASQDVGSNIPVPLTFSYLVTGLSAGTHSFSMASITLGGSTPNFCEPDHFSDDSVCRFTAREIRNSAGTGDIASNGNNTYTGTNTFQKFPNRTKTTFSAVNDVTITLTAGVKTCIDWDIAPSATRSIYAKFNSDTTASKYHGAAWGRDSSANTIAYLNNGVSGFIPLPRLQSVQQTASGEHNVGDFCIMYESGNNNDISVMGQMFHKNPSFYETAVLGYSFDDTTDVTSITFYAENSPTTTISGFVTATEYPD